MYLASRHLTYGERKIEKVKLFKEEMKSMRNTHCEVDGVTRCDKVGTDPALRGRCHSKLEASALTMDTAPS